MRRIALLTALITTQVFAVSDLTFSPDSIGQNDVATLSGTFSSPGDSIEYIYIYDFNSDGIIDTGQDAVVVSSDEEGPFVDGDDEMDTIADGLMSIDFVRSAYWDPFPFAGTYAFVMWDESGSDTAKLVVSQVATSLSVSGAVTGPSGPIEGIAVRVISCSTSNRDDCFVRHGLTDANGIYTVYVSPDFQGKDIFLQVEDMFDILEGVSVIPPEDLDTVLSASLTGIDFLYQQATQFIAGVVIDENGAAIPDAVLEFSEDNLGVEMYIDCDGAGKFVAPVSPGKWDIEMDLWETDGYMAEEKKVTVLETDDTVTITYTAYTADQTITGRVVDPDSVIDLGECDVGASAQVDSNWVFSGTDIDETDGSFSVDVSSQLAPFDVSLWTKDIPHGYYLDPRSYHTVSAGDTGLVFEILKISNVIEGTVLDENENPVINESLYVFKDEWGFDPIPAQTDANGSFYATVAPGDYYFLVDDSSYMQKRMMVSVYDSVDTTEAFHYVHTTDSIISGTISGDTAGLDLTDIVDIGAMVTVSETSGGSSQWGCLAVIDGDGSYKVHVSSLYGPYSVRMEFNGDYYDDYIIFPWEYDSVEAGQDNVSFQMFKIGGTISGKVSFEIPDNAYIAGVKAIDTVTGIEFGSYIDDTDSTYMINVPNGVYRVLAGYMSSTATDSVVIDSIVVQDNDIVINFTADGAAVVPASIPVQKDRLFFSFSSYPNPFRGAARLNFVSPVAGKAELSVFDMTGRLIVTLHSGMVQRGSHTFRLSRDNDGEPLKSGAYCARLCIKGLQEYRKNITLFVVH
ncbi:MAG: hypothetical protein GF401_19210 [Chitinivibrionales bacterium]|nr:hypothetical protein [Chitinivibrionales bacterium]